jgi:hypothetical protein
MEIRGDLTVLNRERRLEYSSETRSPFGMSNNSLDRANVELFLVDTLFRTAKEGFMYGSCLNSYAR